MRTSTVLESRRTGARKQFGFAALLLITALTLFAGRASAYSQVVAFGDSLSDNGNFFALTGAPGAPYFNGRFSNGPVWVETLAGSLGVGLDDRAVGGATTGTVNVNGVGGGITDQFGAYLAGTVDTNALHTVWGGANDFLSLGPTDDPLVASANAVNNIKAGVGDLLDAGVPGKNILVLNLPDLGKTPRSLASPDGGFGATVLSGIFNGQLAFNLEQEFPGSGIRTLDVFTLLNDVLGPPAGLGLTNTTESCFVPDDPDTPADEFFLCDGGSGPGMPPTGYAFWDGIHPTNTLHNELAAIAYAQVVPVPAAVWLFGSAIGLLGFARRRVA
jgi:phospholipase/lecithinase/hemolysin